MPKTLILLALSLSLLTLTPNARASSAAALDLFPLFTDNAVLQRDRPVPVWGWGHPGKTVTVEFAGQTVTAVAERDGAWRTSLGPLKRSTEPQTLVVSEGGQKITRRNILVGDVWLCGGQSNMEMTFSTPRLPVDMPDFVKPGELPTVRHAAVRNLRLKERKGLEDEPQQRLRPNQLAPGWQVCDENTYQKFSATALFFAHTVTKETGVPIGLLNITQGNTRIDSWMSPASAERIADHVPTDSLRAVYSKKAFTNYNVQVAPVAGFAIRGAIWYQGEANAKEGESYFWKKKALIEGWREAWGQGDFPFYFVQLPSYPEKRPGRTWAPIREAQRRTLTLPNTGMVVLTDAGDTGEDHPIDLHPRNKYEVGRRLAQWALANDYGKTDVVPSGPLFRSARFEGDAAVITFDHVGGGLQAAKKASSRSVEPPEPVDQLVGFEIAGQNGEWKPARAVIEADTVRVTAVGVDEPVRARYLWSMNTDHGTLYNAEGLPASPFDSGTDWP